MAEQGFKRSQRVGQLLQQELGRLLIDGLKDPRIGFVTVTEVRPTDDLKSARVYVSVYGEDTEREETLAGLRDAAGYLRRQLGKRVHLRYVPTLNFQHDDSLDRAERLDTLMNAVERGETEIPAAQRREPAPVKTGRTDLAESARTFEKVPEKQPRPRRNRRRKRNRSR